MLTTVEAWAASLMGTRGQGWGSGWCSGLGWGYGVHLVRSADVRLQAVEADDNEAESPLGSGFSEVNYKVSAQL